MATKRVLRALLKAIDLCVSDPEWVARVAAEKELRRQLRLCAAGDERRALRRWRDYDPEDSIRFYALRMNETGMIKASPQQIIADGTDWRFINELKRELKM